MSSGETKVIRQGEVFFVEDTHGKLHVYIVDCDTVILLQGKTGIFDFSLQLSPLDVLASVSFIKTLHCCRATHVTKCT